jgi:hypothetical protein
VVVMECCGTSNAGGAFWEVHPSLDAIAFGSRNSIKRCLEDRMRRKLRNMQRSRRDRDVCEAAEFEGVRRLAGLLAGRVAV